MKNIDSDSGHSPADDEKKLGMEHGEYETLGHDQLPPDPDAHLSPEERAAIDRKLLWKLDLRLIPWLCLLYLISFLDRTSTF